MELLCVVLWRMWYLRNLLVHGRVSTGQEDIVCWCAGFMRDYMEANEYAYGCREQVLPSQISWQPPEESSYKLNCDAALDDRTNNRDEVSRSFTKLETRGIKSPEVLRNQKSEDEISRSSMKLEIRRKKSLEVLRNWKSEGRSPQKFYGTGNQRDVVPRSSTELKIRGSWSPEFLPDNRMLSRFYDNIYNE
ncbi:hypothetical protein LWI29_001656 [Acer saccharum]|uniref:Uncharacterized protein n=1 Tax=Acer saccharum TaxID=4024 RepID=A0AA39T1Y6_ACESA|nr:hypothetical protein LWI29_001656 [Acer saccharum]